MTRLPSRSTVEVLGEQLADYASQIPAINRRLRVQWQIERDYPTMPDGYPPSSGGDHAGQSELTPVEATVDARLRHHDERLARLVAAFDHAREACDRLYALASMLTLLERNDAERAKLAEQNERRCVNHAKWQPDNSYPVYAGGLCRSCYEWRRDHGRAPDADVTRAMDTGGRTAAIRVYQRKQRQAV